MKKFIFSLSFIFISSMGLKANDNSTLILNCRSNQSDLKVDVTIDSIDGSNSAFLIDLPGKSPRSLGVYNFFFMGDTEDPSNALEVWGIGLDEESSAQLSIKNEFADDHSSDRKAKFEYFSESLEKDYSEDVICSFSAS